MVLAKTKRGTRARTAASNVAQTPSRFRGRSTERKSASAGWAARWTIALTPSHACATAGTSRMSVWSTSSSPSARCDTRSSLRSRNSARSLGVIRPATRPAEPVSSTLSRGEDKPGLSSEPDTLAAMNERFEELRRTLGEIHDVEKAAAVLSWDEETKMPPSGAEARAEQRATLNRLAHERHVSPELGTLLEGLRPFEEEHDPDSFEASLIRVARRDYEKAVRVPPELRAELTRAGSLGYQAWLRAREQEDYSIMLPHLERNLELRRRYVACFDPADDVYDIVLDDYEPGTKTAQVEEIFDRLKDALMPMVRAVAEADPIDDACLRGRFPREAQRRFGLSVLEQWGMDREAWRLDKTVLPFASSFALYYFML